MTALLPSRTEAGSRKKSRRISPLGLFEAPCFPANNSIVGAWFPRAERARAIGIYTSAEYVALWLKQAGSESTFFWYVTVMMAVAFLFSLRLPKQAAYLHHDL